MILLVRDAQRHLAEIYRAPGFNLGMNLGESAGAGIAEHIHMHVLPRWPGDTNFMTTVAETRVLPEDLAVTWRKLHDAFIRFEKHTRCTDRYLSQRQALLNGEAIILVGISNGHRGFVKLRLKSVVTRHRLLCSWTTAINIQVRVEAET